MSIQVNPHGRSLWRMDVGEACCIALPSVANSGKEDGIMVKVAMGGKHAEVWLETEEAKSLRDWLVKTLPA
jgi:hypothetical protein